jgi:hypothetical protein
MTPKPPATPGGKVAELDYRRERRAFWWTSGWLAILSLVWTGATGFDYFAENRIAELMVIADGDYLPDLERYLIQVRPWLLSSRILVAFLAIGSAACLVRWLLAIRHRRNHPLA